LFPLVDSSPKGCLIFLIFSVTCSISLLSNLTSTALFFNLIFSDDTFVNSSLSALYLLILSVVEPFPCTGTYFFSHKSLPIFSISTSMRPFFNFRSLTSALASSYCFLRFFYLLYTFSSLSLNDRITCNHSSLADTTCSQSFWMQSMYLRFCSFANSKFSILESFCSIIFFKFSISFFKFSLTLSLSSLLLLIDLILPYNACTTSLISLMVYPLCSLPFLFM